MTPANFYIGSEWIGSVRFDGYPSGIPSRLMNPSSEATFRGLIGGYVSLRGDGWSEGEPASSGYRYTYQDGAITIERESERGGNATP